MSSLSVLKMALSALMTLTLGSWESSLFFRSIQSVGDNNFKIPTKKKKKKPPKVKQLKQLVEEKRCEGWVLGNLQPDDEVKWTFLEHNGPAMDLEYVPLPSNIRFRYDGKVLRLSPATEEGATLYAALLGNLLLDEVFNHNFLETWRSKMTDTERKKICDISKCDFSEISKHFKAEKTKDR